MDHVLWDQVGQPALLLSNQWLVNLKGDVVAFIEENGAVYDLKGRHIAWFRKGILRDCYGYCLALGDAVEDPIHPPLPSHGVMRYRPPRCSAGRPPLTGGAGSPPQPCCTWSMVQLLDLFR
jgi:hypothetical protein